jgi:hypothetical protein
VPLNNFGIKQLWHWQWRHIILISTSNIYLTSKFPMPIQVGFVNRVAVWQVCLVPPVLHTH